MRSRLEADYAAHLDRQGWKWEYEPIVFAGPKGQWLPDFKLLQPIEETMQPIYVELKPSSFLEGGVYTQRIAKVDELLARMAMAWLSEPGAAIQLVFWEWGAEHSSGTVTGAPGLPWTCSRLPFATIWPGMDQASNRPRPAAQPAKALLLTASLRGHRKQRAKADT